MTIKEGDRVMRIHPVNSFSMKHAGIVHGGIYIVESWTKFRIRLKGYSIVGNPNFFKKLPSVLNKKTRII